MLGIWYRPSHRLGRHRSLQTIVTADASEQPFRFFAEFYWWNCCTGHVASASSYPFSFRSIDRQNQVEAVDRRDLLSGTVERFAAVPADLLKIPTTREGPLHARPSTRARPLVSRDAGTPRLFDCAAEPQDTFKQQLRSDALDNHRRRSCHARALTAAARDRRSVRRVFAALHVTYQATAFSRSSCSECHFLSPTLFIPRREPTQARCLLSWVRIDMFGPPVCYCGIPEKYWCRVQRKNVESVLRPKDATPASSAPTIDLYRGKAPYARSENQ